MTISIYEKTFCRNADCTTKTATVSGNFMPDDMETLPEDHDFKLIIKNPAPGATVTGAIDESGDWEVSITEDPWTGSESPVHIELEMLLNGNVVESMVESIPATVYCDMNIEGSWITAGIPQFNNIGVPGGLRLIMNGNWSGMEPLAEIKLILFDDDQVTVCQTLTTNCDAMGDFLFDITMKPWICSGAPIVDGCGESAGPLYYRLEANLCGGTVASLNDEQNNEGSECTCCGQILP